MTVEFPRFRVTGVDRSCTLLSGEVSATEVYRETWVGDGHLGYLLSRRELFPGRWEKRGDDWLFRSARPIELVAGRRPSEYEVLDSYWGERAELVLNTQPDGWAVREWNDPEDHEHCAICWATVSVESNARYHWHAGLRTACCSRCHDSYVMRRSLAFVTPSGSDEE